MKHFLFFFAFALQFQTIAQIPKSLPKCGCDELKLSGRGYFGSEKQAEDLVNAMLLKVARLSKLETIEKIQVKEAACGSPMALVCNTQLPNGKAKEVRVILYNNYFLNRITKNDGPATWIDKHILAHEVGHHVFGDPVNAESIAAYQGLLLKEQGNLSPKRTSNKTDNLQAQEIQADFFGLWLLAKTEPKFDFDELRQSYDTLALWQMENREKRQVSGTHPRFSERLEAMENFWKKLQRDGRRRELIVSRGYFADAATAAYIDLRPEKSFWDVSLGAGLTVFGMSAFRADNEVVDGFLYSLPDAYNTNFNLLVSRLNWQKPLRFELEMGWVRQKYGTTTEGATGKRLVEEVQTSYATVGPRLTWSSVGGHQRLFTGKVGFFGSVGGNFRYPLSFQYVNYAQPLPNSLTFSLRPSVSPRVVVGIEYLKKTRLPRGFKLAFGYEWQQTTFNTTPTARISSHNFDCTFYYSIFRK